MSGGKKSRGSQKIEKTSNKSNMQVTFSKRRSGLFNKAWELFTLHGAYVALMIFSPTGEVFSFGLPDLDMVIDRYVPQAPRLDNDTRKFIDASRSTNLCELYAHLTLLNDALDREKRYKDDQIRICKMIKDPSWSACPIDEMNMDQLKLLKNGLEKMKKHLEELKKNVDQSTN